MKATIVFSGPSLAPPRCAKTSGRSAAKTAGRGKPCARVTEVIIATMNMKDRPATLGALRTAVARGEIARRSVRDEVRDNLIVKLRAGDRLFPGVVGYDETVIPQLVNAILARHNFIILGLRGQAKTRLIRAMVDLLDERDPGRAGQRDPRRPAGADLGARPGAGGGRRRRPADRMAAARGPLRREARHARRDDCRPHRRHRPDQGGQVGSAARIRAGDALRPAAARQPRPLRHQRAAGSGRQGAGRPVQHPPGGGCADQRLPGPPAARRDARLHGQPRGLHGARQDHHAAQGPHRRRDPHPLPDLARAGDGGDDAGSVGAARPEDRRAVLRPRRGRRGGVPGAQRPARGQALGREPAPAHQRARDGGLERRTPRLERRRGAGRARASPTSTPRCRRSPARSSWSTRAS